MNEQTLSKKGVSNEKGGLPKNLLNPKNPNYNNCPLFQNDQENQKFARVQSTPLEEQQKKAGGGGFLKTRLAAKQALKAGGGAGFEFNPIAETGSVTESFLKFTPQEFKSSTTPQNGIYTTLPSNITPTVNKEVPGTLSSTSQSYQLPIIQPSVSDTSSKAIVSTDTIKKKAIFEEDQPKVESKPEPKNKNKKLKEKQFSSPVCCARRKEFEDEVAKLSEKLKDRPLPEGLEKFIGRNIILESKTKRGKQQTKGLGELHRQPKEEKTLDKVSEDGLSSITTVIKNTIPEQPKTFVGFDLPSEELEMKEKFSKNENAWIAGKKSETDPEEDIEKEIKFNLNMITFDNLDEIREKIREIASQNVETCKKVADFLIETACSRNDYANTYAKLCEYLSKEDRLNFDRIKKSEKNKNDFKLFILKKIQDWLEEDFFLKKSDEKVIVDERSLQKQRFLRHMNFVGELFLEQFIFKRDIDIITINLLREFLRKYNLFKNSPEKASNKFYEDILEGLVKFYEMTGKVSEEIETRDKLIEDIEKYQPSNFVRAFERNVQRINMNIPFHLYLAADETSVQDLFKILEIILSEVNLSPRLKILIKELILQKENHWKNSRILTQEEIQNKISNDLDNITYETFDVIKEEIIYFASKSIENCDKISELMMEKISNQPQHSSFYARLCYILSQQEDLKSDKLPDKNSNTFKQQILKKISNVLESNNKEEDFGSQDSHKKLLSCINFLGEFIPRVGMMRLVNFLLLSRFLVEYEEFKVKATKNKFYEDILDAFIGFLRIARKEIFGKDAPKPKTDKKSQLSSCIVTSFQAVFSAINKRIVPVPKLSELEPSFEELIEILQILKAEITLSSKLVYLIDEFVELKKV